MNIEKQKVTAAYKACSYVKEGMRIGLGSGSTLRYVLECLQQKVKDGLHIEVVCSSLETLRLAQLYKLPQLMDETRTLDLNIDGVDQIDDEGNAIKGGGAALTREKVLAQWAAKTIWIMDERKPVQSLDTYKLPIEVIPFALPHLFHTASEAGYTCEIRKEGENTLVTDNGNHILDVYLPKHTSMKEAHDYFIFMAGVVETGYFEGILSLAIIASSIGIQERNHGFINEKELF